MRESLIPTDAPGVYRLAANAAPSESVVDVYGSGYLMQAESVGPGLAFAESARPDWQETMEMRAMKAGRAKTGVASEDKVEVEIRLEDVLRQGGLIYPVESVSVERVWYCTAARRNHRRARGDVGRHDNDARSDDRGPADIDRRGFLSRVAGAALVVGAASPALDLLAAFPEPAATPGSVFRPRLERPRRRRLRRGA